MIPGTDMAALLLRVSLGAPGAEAELDETWKARQAEFAAARAALEAQLRAIEMAERSAEAAVGSARAAGSAARAVADALKPWGIDPSRLKAFPTFPGFLGPR